MLDNTGINLEVTNEVATAKKTEFTIKEMCQDEEVAAFFRLVVQGDMRQKAIEELEKRISNITLN